MRLIHASLNGRLQVTFLLRITYFCGGRSVLNCMFLYEDGAMQVLLRDIEILAIVWCYRIQLLLTGRRNCNLVLCKI